MLYLFVFTQFRTQNRFALLLELLKRQDARHSTGLVFLPLGLSQGKCYALMTKSEKVAATHDQSR
ncbi:hypothetical protein LC607_34305 [Nostoc sp. CHAB 5824]|nr:hypothetical protein [Nostoc sp. CHAB 5824]